MDASIVTIAKRRARTTTSTTDSRDMQTETSRAERRDAPVWVAAHRVREHRGSRARNALVVAGRAPLASPCRGQPAASHGLRRLSRATPRHARSSGSSPARGSAPARGSSPEGNLDEAKRPGVSAPRHERRASGAHDLEGAPRRVTNPAGSGGNRLTRSDRAGWRHAGSRVALAPTAVRLDAERVGPGRVGATDG